MNENEMGGVVKDRKMYGKAMCGLQLGDREKAEDLTLKLCLTETRDEFATANIVC